MVVHPAIAAPLAALDAAHVRWCLLRGELDLGRPSGDLDVLVAPLDRDRLRGAVRALGFAPLRTPGRGSHQFFIAYARDADAWVKLDIVTALDFGRHQELETDAAPAVLAARRRAGTLWLPSAPDAFWALLLHALLDKGAVRPAHARRLRQLAGTVRGAGCVLADVVEAACPPGWNARRVVDAAGDGRWTQLLSLASDMRARWPGRTRRARALRIGRRAAMRRLARAPVRLRGRGPSVALVGTHAPSRATLAAALERSWPGGARTLHFRDGVVRRSPAAAVHRLRGRLVILDGATTASSAVAEVVIHVEPSVDLDSLHRRATQQAWQRWAPRLIPATADGRAREQRVGPLAKGGAEWS